MGADQLVRLLPAYKEEDNSTVWMALDAVLLGLDKVIYTMILYDPRQGNVYNDIDKVMYSMILDKVMYTMI